MTEAIKRILTSPALALLLRLYLGGVFVYASIYKINYAGEFAQTIASYQMVPHWALNPMAVFMPWLELVCGLLLIAGIRARAAVMLINIMLVMFTVAIASVLLRGIELGCGCFHSMEDPMSWTTIVRDLVWLAMGVQVYFFDRYFHLDHTFAARLSRRISA